MRLLAAAVLLLPAAAALSFSPLGLLQQWRLARLSRFSADLHERFGSTASSASPMGMASAAGKTRDTQRKADSATHTIGHANARIASDTRTP